MKLEKIKIKHPFTKEECYFICREGSSDVKTVKEMFIDKIYVRKGLGFFPEQNETWVDMGGNIGAFSVFAAKICKHINIYEPEEKNCEMIMQNLKINNIENFNLYRGAVVPDSFAKNKVTFYVNKNPNHFWMHSMFKCKKDTVEKVVPAIKFSEAKGDCLKMDIEGAEIFLLDEQDFSQFKKVVFEYSFDKDRLMKNFIRRCDRLEEKFNVKRSRNQDHLDTYEFYPPATNVFAIRKSS